MLIKYVSLNLWHGGRLFDEIVDFIKREDPDILAMQEVYQSEDMSLERRHRAFQELGKALDFPHRTFAPALMHIIDVGKVEQGNAVFSKFPIAKQEVEFYDRPYGEVPDEREYFPVVPRQIQHVELETPAGRVNVLNTHGVWDLDGDNDSPQRRRMGELMIKMSEGKPHVILSGDTNAKPTNPSMRKVAKHLTSVFGDSLATTFNMRHKTNPGYATAAVDMMFVSADMKVVSKSCPDVNVSDHLPLVATLEI